MFLDSTHPELLEIGNDVQIARDVRIITHGYDWAVLKGKYGDILGSAGKVKIGNNVFIGMNATILKGTVIGDNCIIGENSLVNGCFPDDVVIAGNPAKVICTIEEYYHKRIAAQLHEARELVKEYFACYHKVPEKEVLDEFFWIWEESRSTMRFSFVKCIWFAILTYLWNTSFRQSRYFSRTKRLYRTALRTNTV